MAAFRAAGSPSPGSTPVPTPAPASGVVYPLKVSGNNRYLVDQNSVPFMVAGDSAWSLIVNLTEDQAATYFADRKADGFNTVLLSLFAGADIFGRSDFSTYDGIVPFTTPGDISTPSPAYFQRVDEMINLAASFGLCVFLDPIENYGWEATFESSGATQCAAFGNYIGNRYKNFPNIVWSNANDYQDWPAADTVFLAIVNGIKAVDTNHIHTLELDYNNSMAFDDPHGSRRFSILIGPTPISRPMRKTSVATPPRLRHPISSAKVSTNRKTMKPPIPARSKTFDAKSGGRFAPVRPDNFTAPSGAMRFLPVGKITLILPARFSSGT